MKIPFPQQRSLTFVVAGIVALVTLACGGEGGPLAPEAPASGPQATGPAPCSQVYITHTGSTNLTYKGTSITATANLICSQGSTFLERQFTWYASPGGIVTLTPSGSGLVNVAVNPNLNGGSVMLRVTNGTGLTAFIVVNVSRLQVTSAYDGSTLNELPNSGGSAPFTVQNIGAGPLSFTMACSATGAVSCSGITVQPSPSTLNTGQTLNVNMPYSTSSNQGTGTLRLMAGGVADTVHVNVSNNTGAPLSLNFSPYPSPVQPNVACTWTATAMGGTLPYTYDWTVDGNPAFGNGGSLTFSNFGNPFTLGVTVTDGAGTQLSASGNIEVSSSGSCLQ